jgi:hypothetical protein
MPAHLDLFIYPAKEVHTLRSDIDPASVPGTVQSAELRMIDEFPGCLLRQIAVPARDVHSANAKLTNLAVGQWVELVDL